MITWICNPHRHAWVSLHHPRITNHRTSLLQYSTNKGYCEDLTQGKFSFPIIHAIRADQSNRQVLSPLLPLDYTLEFLYWPVHHCWPPRRTTKTTDHTNNQIIHCIIYARFHQIVCIHTGSDGKSRGSSSRRNCSIRWQRPTCKHIEYVTCRSYRCSCGNLERQHIRTISLPTCIFHRQQCTLIRL